MSEDMVCYCRNCARRCQGPGLLCDQCFERFSKRKVRRTRPKEIGFYVKKKDRR